jgi:hypothetical protein
LKHCLMLVFFLVALLAVSAFPLLADELYSELSVGNPLVYGNLAVYPIYLPGGGEKLGDILTLDEALDTGKFKITELEEGASVNLLEVHNKTNKYVVLLAGQIIHGAKQDRIISYDTVIPPKTTYYVDVFCVEAGRWNEVSDSFSYKGEIAPSKIRYSSQEEQNQGAIWDSVSTINQENKVYSDSEALSASYNSKNYQELMDKYRAAFGNIAKDSDVVGVLAVSEGSVQAGDIFANHDLFAKVWDRLLTSYSMDAALSSGLGSLPSVEKMEEYLAQLQNADRKSVYQDEIQQRSDLSGDGVNAYELKYADKKLHINLY